jgi:hypothetical protein
MDEKILTGLKPNWNRTAAHASASVSSSDSSFSCSTAGASLPQSFVQVESFLRSNLAEFLKRCGPFTPVAFPGPEARRHATDASHPNSSGPASTHPTAGSSDLTQQAPYFTSEKVPSSKDAADKSPATNHDKSTGKVPTFKDQASTQGLLARAPSSPGEGTGSEAEGREAALRSLLAEFQGSPTELLALMQKDEEAEEEEREESEEGGAGSQRRGREEGGGPALGFEVEPIFSGGMMEALLGKLEEGAEEDISSPVKNTDPRRGSLQGK